MALLVADTSALISLGTIITDPNNPLDILLNEHQVVIPEHVVSEHRATASSKTVSQTRHRLSSTDLRNSTYGLPELDEDLPLDDGENAAVTLANDLDATQLLCDEFNHLALVHASLADSRLVTTPTLLTVFVRNEYLSAEEAEDLLSAMSDARSWASNSYVAQATSTLQ